MESETERFSSARTFLVIAAAVGLLWQLFLIVLAIRHGDTLRVFLSDLGVEPPMVTRLYLASYKWWPVAPVLSAVAAYLPLRRPARLQARAALAAALPLVVGLILQAWMDAAAINPLYEIIQRVR